MHISVVCKVMVKDLSLQMVFVDWLICIHIFVGSFAKKLLTTTFSLHNASY